MDLRKFSLNPARLAGRPLELSDLEENPLALFLSGARRAFWQRVFRKRLRPPIWWAPYAIAPMLWIAMPCYAPLVAAFAFPVWRYLAFEAWWRECARSGRLMDWYLSMTPEQIVLGLAGGRFLKSGRAHWVAGAIYAVLAFAVTLLIGMAAGSGPLILVLAVALGIAAAVTQMLIEMDTVHTTFDSIAVSIEWARVPAAYRKLNARMGDIMISWVDMMLRAGLPAFAGYFPAIIMMALMSLVAPPDMMMVCGAVAILIFVSVTAALYMFLFHKRRIVELSFKRAIEAVGKYQLEVIDSNPFS